VACRGTEDAAHRSTTKGEVMTRQEFQELIQAVVDVVGVDAAADALRTSRPTIRRWIDGRSEPHPTAYASIAQCVAKVLLGAKAPRP
jgi:hypothetical protein